MLLKIKALNSSSTNVVCNDKFASVAAANESGEFSSNDMNERFMKTLGISFACMRVKHDLQQR